MLEIIVVVCLCLGLLLFCGTAVGVLRFPDFFSRLHASSKGDTISSLLLLIGLALYNMEELSFASILVGVKVLLIMVIVFITSPTAAHALTDAAYAAGARPWVKHKREEDDEE